MAAGGKLSITSTKAGPKSAPTPPSRANFVLGSRPPDMYAPRIKPLDAQRQYGKQPGQTTPAAPLNPLLMGGS